MHTNSIKARPFVISTLVALCGVAASAQSTTGTLRTDQPSATQRGQQTSRALVYFSTLKGTDITNSSGDTVAEIEDIIFDRYSGDISAIIVDADESRVISPSEIEAELQSDGSLKFTTALTEATINSHQKFDAAAFEPTNFGVANYQAWWTNYDQTANTWQSKNPVPSKNWTERARSMDSTKVDGEVTAVYRIEGESGAYRTVAEIQGSDGQKRTVLLGPAWYLAEHQTLPSRGQKVSMSLYPIETVEGAEWAASQVAIDGGKPIDLRTGKEMNPAWATPERGLISQRRLVLASNIVGDNAKCREDFSGDVDDLVIDHNAGRVLAFSVDPNENFLGMGDTSRLIPLSVASHINKDEIYIDATKDMIVKSPAAPSSLNEMNNAWNIDEIFNQRPIAYRR